MRPPIPLPSHSEMPADARSRRLREDALEARRWTRWYSLEDAARQQVQGAIKGVASRREQKDKLARLMFDAVAQNWTGESTIVRALTALAIMKEEHALERAAIFHLCEAGDSDAAFSAYLEEREAKTILETIEALPGFMRYLRGDAVRAFDSPLFRYYVYLAWMHKRDGGGLVQGALDDLASILTRRNRIARSGTAARLTERAEKDLRVIQGYFEPLLRTAATVCPESDEAEIRAHLRGAGPWILEKSKHVPEVISTFRELRIAEELRSRKRPRGPLPFRTMAAALFLREQSGTHSPAGVALKRAAERLLEKLEARLKSSKRRTRGNRN